MVGIQEVECNPNEFSLSEILTKRRTKKQFPSILITSNGIHPSEKPHKYRQPMNTTPTNTAMNNSTECYSSQLNLRNPKRGIANDIQLIHYFTDPAFSYCRRAYANKIILIHFVDPLWGDEIYGVFSTDREGAIEMLQDGYTKERISLAFYDIVSASRIFEELSGVLYFSAKIDDPKLKEILSFRDEPFASLKETGLAI